MKYRKKPVVIEAIQFINGGSWPEVKKFCPTARCEINPEIECRLIIPTLEGDHIAREGDWIIKGVEGEFYPCKPHIFQATYEPED